MPQKHNHQLLHNARLLRKNMTKEERHLWYDFLKNHSYHFKKQKIIGNYIADFYCAQKHLVIEIDGVQHFEKENEIKDDQRTDYFRQLGLKVIRIPNSVINNNFQGVCYYISELLEGRVSDETGKWLL